MKLQRTDKDYLIKLAVFLWLHERTISDINDHVRMNGVYLSDNALRVKIHRYKYKSSYKELSDIAESGDLPPEFVNKKLILAKKGIHEPEFI